MSVTIDRNGISEHLRFFRVPVRFAAGTNAMIVSAADAARPLPGILHSRAMMSSAGMPDWLEPMAATLTQERFTGPDWMFERKFDGIRLLAYKRGGDVAAVSRATGCRRHLPDVAAAVADLPVDESILDGEMTWDGRSAYHVFDILWLDGRDVTALPLEERRGAARDDCRFEAPHAARRPLDDRRAVGARRREGWEGVIAKRRGSPYEHRRSKHWLKMKCERAQELVVGGFTDPQGARVGLGALLVGYYDGDDFVFAGKIGTGFDTKLLLDLRARLDAIEMPAVAVHEGDGPAAPARALGAAGDRRAGRLHRVDRARQAAPSAAARRPHRQSAARRGEGRQP